jgi:hypothetical protein
MTIESGSVPKDCSLRGEWAELRFMARAAEHGVRAIKPWGDCSRYDFVVEIGGQFQRVQVKSTSCRRGNQYAFSLQGANRRPYTKDEVDFFGAFIIPLEVWYIIPIGATGEGKYNIIVSPHNSLSKYAAYREAWHLLRGDGADGGET